VRRVVDEAGETWPFLLPDIVTRFHMFSRFGLREGKVVQGFLCE